MQKISEDVLLVDGHHRHGITLEAVTKLFKMAETFFRLEAPHMLPQLEDVKAALENPEIPEAERVALVAVMQPNFSCDHTLGVALINDVQWYYYLSKQAAEIASRFSKVVIVTTDELERLSALNLPESRNFYTIEDAPFAVSVPRDIAFVPKTINSDGFDVPFTWQNPDYSGSFNLLASIDDKGEIHYHDASVEHGKAGKLMRLLASVMNDADDADNCPANDMDCHGPNATNFNYQCGQCRKIAEN
jgi:hypothetical protein